MYSNGASEEIIGKALKKYEIPRHKVVILTKCFAAVGEDPSVRFVIFCPCFRSYLGAELLKHVQF